MKKILGALCLLLAGENYLSAQQSRLIGYAEESYYDGAKLNFVRIKETMRVNESEVTDFINMMVFDDDQNTVQVNRTERDELGFTHIRYNVLQKNIPVSGKMIIAHCKSGKLISLNGDLYDVKTTAARFTLTEKAALAHALKKVNAVKYKWENRAEEQHMREALNQPDFTYYPHGSQVIFEKQGRSYPAYVFNIYADEPLYRANVFVDASNGKILEEQNLLCTSDVTGTAVTKYSGTQTITCDQNGTQYRLKEVARGLGIETYNMANTTLYASTNFTNASPNWTSTGVDQAATDAHWGAEKTYDYYLSQHNRNSINNAGFKLLSYVHYSTNYSNAFWDGQRMTYGDGNGGTYKIFTALDVCGHEISHGLTSSTSNLNYANESGALNESYSDIFGTCIENYARPSNWNWKIGEDLMQSAAGLRNMSNPGLFGDPDTYMGTNYYTGTADNGGVHTNSGVSNYWFYLLTAGGAGTNDLNNVFSVTGIGFTNAAKIAFRALTVYYTPTTNYATARNLSIQAAKDLFGVCSNEMIQTTRAWYAVGVGPNYVQGVVGPNFGSGMSTFCTLPATVSFNNTTANGLTYSWDFGDGSALATSTNAVHVYTANGTYNVKLKAAGCSNAVDSLTQTGFVVINVPAAPVVSPAGACLNSPAVLNATGTDVLKWFDSPSGGVLLGSGNSFTTTAINSPTTYYVANTVPSTPSIGGMLAGTGGGYLTNNAQWLIFDVVQTSTLNSVVMFAQTAGNRVIQLRSANNAVINSYTANLAVGNNTVSLGFPLTIGTNYRLGLSATSTASLFRSNSGVTYPYNVGNCVTITGSSAGSGAYYWYYRWEVVKEECTSPLVPVAVAVNPLPSVSLPISNTVVCVDDVTTLNGVPGGGVYSGLGVTGNSFSGSNIGPGTYMINYIYTDANGCSGTDSTQMFVTNCTGLSAAQLQEVSLYPNPASDKVIFRQSSLMNGNISLSDASGRVVLVSQISSAEQEISLSGLSRGLYIVQVRDASGKSVSTLKLVKE